MKLFDNQEHAKQQAVDPETRHLQLIRSNVIEHAVEQTLKAMDENYHGIPLKIVPTPQLVAEKPAPMAKVYKMEDYRPQAVDFPATPTQISEPIPDNVTDLNAYRRQVEQAHDQAHVRITPQELSDDSEAA